MSFERMTDTLDRLLRRVLLAIAVGIIGIAAAMMLAMDESSASQGGRFYIAVIAIVLLGAVEYQLRRLLRRRLPFSLTAHPAERRHARDSLVLIALASALLLGLALYLTSGMSTAILRLFAYILALAAAPFLVHFLMHRFVKKPFERGIDLLFGADDATSPPVRTFTFSFGRAPTQPDLEDAIGARHTPALPADREEFYRERWLQIRTRFESDPAQAVRDAHLLVLELCTEAGYPAAMLRGEQFDASDLSGAASSLAAMVERVGNAHEAERGVQAALAREPATPADLKQAMSAYERMLAQILMHTHSQRYDRTLQT